MRAQPTVVRLEHLEGPAAGWISECYHQTADVRRHLKALAAALERPQGTGIFVIGQYGCGKSHLLAFITQQLRAGRLGPGGVEVVTVSLVNYASSDSLEQVVATTAGVAPGGDRREAWAARLRTAGPGGVLIIIDELSEFLRSKPNARAFNEDIRFLQFLGEWASGHRLWIVAAMQEQIEHTGEIEVEAFRKIKDRYPIRMRLTPTHVRDLVSESILIKAPSYHDAVAALAERFESALPAGMLDRAALQSIYPVHPVSLELLEEVRDRFSQARGVVDFVSAQLGGDTRRGIEPLLDEPWGTLLTPDRIVTHFRDLFEVQPEFVPLSSQVLPHYERHMAGLFSTDRLRKLAERVLHLLILVQLSPLRTDLGAEEAAAWLLLTASRLDPQKSVRVVQKVLAKLAREGRFVAERRGRYSLTLEDDGAGRLERLLAREVEALRSHDPAVFLESIVALLPADGFNPLTMPRNRWNARAARWYFHERPFAVWVGNQEPTRPQPAPGLCIRLPWGVAEPAGGCYVLSPKPLDVTDGVLELAGMVRLRDTGLDAGLRKRLDQRLAERIPPFYAQIKSAYTEAALAGPDGGRETPPRIDSGAPLMRSLGAFGEWMLAQTYPSFERFAPAHGPLPSEAYRALMRAASDGVLLSDGVDRTVQLVREAYLVPMGLLARRGRSYTVPRKLDEAELVRLLRPMVEHHPLPQVIYDRLQAEPYGLVDDQVHLLLAFLVIQGEIDITKGKRSYRDAWGTAPLPSLYDRVVPGRALTLDQLSTLKALCDGFAVKPPRAWTALAQRRAIQELRGLATQRMAALQALRIRLAPDGPGRRLYASAGTLLSRWEALDDGNDDIEAFVRFTQEIGSATRFVEAETTLRSAADKLEQRVSELGRLVHLLGHAAVLGWPHSGLGRRVAELGDPPELDEADALDRWIDRATATYAAFVDSYREHHDAFWAAHTASKSPWRPPAIAGLRVLGLDEALAAQRHAAERMRALTCLGRGYDPRFQALCKCGFDGERAAISDIEEAAVSAREQVEAELRAWFRDPDVRARIRAWRQEGHTGSDTPGVAAYLTGDRPWPETPHLEGLGRCLVGALEPVATFDLGQLTARLAERARTRDDAIATLAELLRPLGRARIRFELPDSPGAGDARLSEVLVRWCAVELAVHGTPLPSDLSAAERRRIGAALPLERVGPDALNRLDRLGLDRKAQDAVLRGVLDGRVRPPTDPPGSGLARAALEVAHPTDPVDADELAALASALYRADPRLAALAGDAWARRLDRLARTPLPSEPATLTDVLLEYPGDTWVLLDALGLPLLPRLRAELPALLTGWEVVTSTVASVPAPTTTANCVQALLEELPTHPIEKIDVVDTLLHQGCEPLRDLADRAIAELSVTLRRLQERLDPARPVLIFADHGFRLSEARDAWVHGGDSTLERTVPVLRLVRS